MIISKFKRLLNHLFREQLLAVLLRITSLVLTPHVPLRKEDTLGGRLAPAFFQVGLLFNNKPVNYFVSTLQLNEQFFRL